LAPSGLSEGATRQLNISATLNHSNATEPLISTLTRSDVTTVSNSNLVLLKQVCNKTTDNNNCADASDWGINNQAGPGQTLIYRINFSNTGIEAITNLVVSDVTPSYTTFSSAICSTPLPLGITACAATTQPAVGGFGVIQWTLTGALPPAAAGDVRFEVVVE
jgi:uncharacterized repeat protein (TIGR01451 family)